MIFGNRFGFPFSNSLMGGGFNPLIDVNGLELYLNKKNATVSSWLDQSTNAFDFTQATAAKQPTISANSVDFDGVDDVLEISISNPFVADSSGIFFFSGYYDNSGTNRVLYLSDETVTNSLFGIGVTILGEIFFSSNVPTGTNNTIKSTNTITNGAYYYGYVKSTGTAYEINLNGTIETLVVAGSNNGQWFADYNPTWQLDNMTLGALHRSDGYFYGPTNNNKIIYSNDYTIDTAPVLNFMSNPSN